ncbi:MutS-related protein [Segatella copri]|uniref:MutS-related protein n=1 Tax=Segatella copri TaxID=165179 RepID=UPI0018617025|nr:DNA mismatch repair protein MutS [Segatella copri]MBM0157097.1 DNA mismatch repair protein MutS [Segatella copri]QNT66829.1 DNA mismatch repair protein MutS [Segatella copri]
MNIKENYQQYVSRYAAEVAALKRKNTGFITGELLAFGGILAFLICYFALDGDTQNYLMGAALCLIAYLGIRRLDDKNKEKIEHLSALLKVYQDEIKALEGDFSPFETGDFYQNPQHSYSFDLDVFGKSSLFNRICRTITSGGSEALARNLTRETPLSLEDIKRRRDLQKELAGEGENWRMEFLALGEKNRSQTADGKMMNGKMKKIDSAAVVDAMQKVSMMEVPAWFGAPISLVIGWLLIIGVIGSVILSICNMVSVNFALWWVLVQYMVMFFVCKQTLDKIDSNGGKLRHQLIAYAQILRLINRRNFHSELGKEMQESLADALPSFAQLEKILKGYDRRGNFLGLFFTDAFMLSDFFLVRSFLKWKNTYMMKMEEWMHIISEMDAMVSMANFRYNHPEAEEAEFVSGKQEADEESVVSENTEIGSPEIVFEGKNLYHPFLGAKAVKNDFTIRDDNYYIITGANMAGKSTFLRSLGVNYILAMAGMPVFADQLKISRFRLFSSMRTTDDLTHGISYFNAELIRLEELLKFCKESAEGKFCKESAEGKFYKKSIAGNKESLRTLIILDEILKGTNSLDKLNGSRKFLEAISKQPVSGIIATHDLELSKMENDASGKFHNYCFEIDLGTDVTYTYKIQKGVARNQNATFLLNKILEKY